jgi:hypothetical protein
MEACDSTIAFSGLSSFPIGPFYLPEVDHRHPVVPCCSKRIAGVLRMTVIFYA